MAVGKGYRVEPFGANRQLVAATSSINREQNTIHLITEMDITQPRRLIADHRERTRERLSLTGYVVTCLAQTLTAFPRFNALRIQIHVTYQVTYIVAAIALTTLGLALAGCASTPLTDVPPAMVGTWQGDATIIVAWVDQETLPVTITIAENGVVEGTAGDATLVAGHLRKNPLGAAYLIVPILMAQS